MDSVDQEIIEIKKRFEAEQRHHLKAVKLAQEAARTGSPEDLRRYLKARQE